MDGVGSNDLDRALSVLAAAREAPEPDAMASAILPGLRALIGCNSVAYNDLVLGPPRARFLTDPVDEANRADEEAAKRTLHEHPVMAYQGRTGDQTVRTVSEFLTESELHRCGFYNDFWRELEVEYQLWLALSPVDGTSIHLSFQRQATDFSPREQAICELLRPQLAAAYRQAVARKAVDELAGHVVFLGADGRPSSMSQESRRLLSAYFPAPRAVATPEPLAEWVERARRLHRQGVGLGRLPEPLVRAGEAGTLTVRFVGASDGRARDALLLAEDLPSGLSEGSLAAAGLTPRQSEVLRCAVRGLANDAIALDLGISRRTVEKHLERAYRCLGVSGRREAVRLLRR
jgi:DNA-binding CsgD family transcriptional regulator